jgi:hypothetical protein
MDTVFPPMQYVFLHFSNAQTTARFFFFFLEGVFFRIYRGADNNVQTSAFSCMTDLSVNPA